MSAETKSDSEIPFISYYGKNKISPVAQDISDFRRHLERRDSLYRQLGIPPGLVTSKSVIEFGPGSGHNSVYTLRLNPKKYVLVDGNPSGLESLKRLLEPLSSEEIELEVVHSLIEKYQAVEKFDVVLCEGVIPFQLDPSRFTKHVSSFVKDSGLLVVSCADSVSQASEIIRKICASFLMSRKMSLEEKVDEMLPVFSPHLDTLKGMSRYYRDWILDVLLHDWVGPVFSIAEAIDTLSPEFQAHGFSPDFVTDWRWYKDIYGDAFQSNELVLKSYFSNVHNFIDYRIVSPPIDGEENQKLIDVCNSLFQLHYVPREEDHDKKLLISELIGHVERLEELTTKFSSLTSISFGDCREAISHYQKYQKFGDFKSFCSLWGRGQQYASFVKRASY